MVGAAALEGGWVVDGSGVGSLFRGGEQRVGSLLHEIWDGMGTCYMVSVNR